jgi:predicted metal-dependent phosphoesterase TrpH
MMIDQPAENQTRTARQRIQVDLHIHSCYSTDSLLSLEELIEAVTRRGLGAIAVLDHNVIDGAFALREIAPFPVIVGEEILTTEGEIAGLFLQGWIPPKLTPAQTVARIKEQGGLVYVPHPFDRYRSSALGERALLEITDQVDVLEVLNARALYSADNERAANWARQHNIPGGAGSDAHSIYELGRAYVEMEPFSDKETFLANLRQGEVGGGLSSPHVHVYSTWAKITRQGGRSNG